MAATKQLKDLVEQLPGPDRRGMLTENIDKEKIEATIAAIYQGGRENVLGLIDLLGEPGSEADVKPHYALHCLLNHTLVVKDEVARRKSCEILAGELAGDRPAHIKAYLCQELGWAGRGESVAALAALLADEELCAPAAMALCAIGEGAAAAFRAAWPKAVGKARLSVIDGLAALPDAPAAGIFKKALRDDDLEVRIAAAAGLANLGDASAASALVDAFATAKGWERFQAAKSCLVLAEKTAESGRREEALELYRSLRIAADTGGDDRHIRDAVDRGVAAVSGG